MWAYTALHGSVFHDLSSTYIYIRDDEMAWLPCTNNAIKDIHDYLYYLPFERQ
jgi:hypothetical protein